MRKYTIFHALILAPIFSRSLYADVGRRWKGIGLGYMMLLLLIAWLPLAIEAHVKFGAFVRDDLPAGLKSVPAVTIRAGRMSTPVKQPYIIRDDRGKALVVLDTTGQVTDPEQVEAQLLVTQTQFIQDNHGSKQIRELRDFPDMVIDATKLQDWAGTLATWMGPLVLVSTWAFTVCTRLVGMLIFAAIGMGLASAMHVRLDFAALLRLTATAMTGVILLDTVLWFVPSLLTSGCIYSMFCWAVTLGYLAFAIRANVRTEDADYGDTGGSGAYPPPLPLAPNPYGQSPR